MSYTYYGYGAYDPSYHTNTGLPYNKSIETLALAAKNGELEGFRSAYGVGGGCTGWASGRSYMASGRDGGDGGHAVNGFERYEDPYGIRPEDANRSSFKEGDVLCFGSGYGHVAFIEKVTLDIMYISEAAYGDNNGNVLCMSRQSINDLMNRKKHWFGGEPGLGILKGTGVAPGPTPPGPTPTPGGHGVYDHTETFDILEQEVANQDNPNIPSATEYMPESDDIRNVHGVSTNLFTDERQIHYPVRSSGFGEEDGARISSSAFITDGGD